MRVYSNIIINMYFMNDSEGNLPSSDFEGILLAVLRTLKTHDVHNI